MNATNPMQVFAFDSSAVRVQLDSANEPWFNANDLCAALEYKNPRQAISSHVDAEDVRNLDTLTPGGAQSLNFVNESGMYALIFGSKKESAKVFKRWVTHEVLPSIRKTGQYVDPQAAVAGDEVLGVGRLLSHKADILVAADRIFRSGMRSARTAGLPTHKAIAVAGDYCLRKTGVDLLQELRIPAECTAPPAAVVVTSTPVQFWQAFTNGELPGFPSLQDGLLFPAASTDVYTLYSHWCRRHGVFQSAMSIFVVALRNEGVTISRPRILHNGVTKQITVMAYLDNPMQGRDAEWLSQRVHMFRDALVCYAQADVGVAA